MYKAPLQINSEARARPVPPASVTSGHTLRVPATCDTPQNKGIDFNNQWDVVQVLKEVQASLPKDSQISLKEFEERTAKEFKKSRKADKLY